MLVKIRRASEEHFRCSRLGRGERECRRNRERQCREEGQRYYIFLMHCCLHTCCLFFPLCSLLWSSSVPLHLMYDRLITIFQKVTWMTWEHRWMLLYFDTLQQLKERSCFSTRWTVQEDRDQGQVMTGQGGERTKERMRKMMEGGARIEEREERKRDPHRERVNDRIHSHQFVFCVTLRSFYLLISLFISERLYHHNR